MAQPFNYTIQAPSAFESLVSGLRLGTSLEEMRFQQEQRAAQVAQAQQKAMQEQQQQRRLQEIHGKVNAGNATRGDWIELGDLSRSEATRKGVWETIGRMDEDKVNARVGIAQQFGFGLLKNADLTKKLMDDYLEANQNDPEIKRIRELADMDAQFAGNALLASLPGMGKQGMDAYGKIVDRLFPEAEKPAETFRTLDAAAVEKQFGFQNVTPGLYRMNTTTGKLESVGGGGGTQVTIKNEGSIPEGYRRIRDPQGNPLYDEPLPGSPAAAKFEAARKAETARAEGRTQASTIVTQEIDALTTALDAEEKATGTDKLNPYVRFTGIPGKAFEGVPGSARKSAQGFIDTIRANIGFEQLDKMRQESPTGGALGNITEQELKFLQSTLGTLDLDSDPAVLRRNLKRIRELYENVMRKAAAYPNADKYGFGAGGAAPAGGSQQPAEVPAPAAAPPTGGRNIGGGFRVLD
jgi:hypothetical protein